MASNDAIVLLKADHTQLRRLFRDFDATSPTAVARQSELVGRILELLTVHTYLENECMYPEVRERLPELDQDILESYEEHPVADVLCTELAAMAPDDEHFHAKTSVLIESVRHHLEEEEQDWFPKVRAGLGRKTLQDLGTRMLELRKTAPRQPAHPSAVKKAINALLS